MVDTKKAVLEVLDSLISRVKGRMKHKDPPPRTGQPPVVTVDPGKVLVIVTKARNDIEALS